VTWIRIDAALTFGEPEGIAGDMRIPGHASHPAGRCASVVRHYDKYDVALHLLRMCMVPLVDDCPYTF
jgi:hypothetical protein